MTTMTQQDPERQVFAVVGTHAETHHAAVVDVLGRHLGDRDFAATPAGYRGANDARHTVALVRMR